MIEKKPTPLIHAPQLPAHPARWLNADGQAIQITPGTVYLLDFFTYCCINCIHVLPDLAYLEQKYRDYPFAVIGIHSGKFDNEKQEKSLSAAIERLRIGHPVVRDDDYHVWRSYGVRAWPTLILVDARGYLVASVSGEGNRAVLEQAIDELFAATTTPLTVTAPPSPLSSPLRFRVASAQTPLSFPGKVLADSERQRLFIADTNHHRLVVAPLTGGGHASGEYRYIGDDSGEPGLRDGGFAVARFNAPQGMALSRDGDILYVADTGNHAIRRVHLRQQTLETIAGSGQQKIGPLHDGIGNETPLNSPWDVALFPSEDTLFIAMAGSHQIARLDLTTGELTVFAGTGREARVDGPVQQAAFAQPSGLTGGGDTLLVADAETSCIRAIHFSPEPMVTTVAGSGGLFDFGSADGLRDQARFQHPLGVACSADGSKVYVTDTYNHTLRVIERGAGQVSTLVGGQSSVFFEPGGLSIAANQTAYIADTNHHRICAVSLADASVTEVPLPGLCAPGLCFPDAAIAEAGAA